MKKILTLGAVKLHSRQAGSLVVAVLLMTLLMMIAAAPGAGAPVPWEHDATIELITFLSMARAYYWLSEEDRTALREFAQEHDTEGRLIPWLKLLRSINPEDLTRPVTWQFIAEFIRRYR